MPKIYEYFGFIFYFWSNEHEPIHVHVKKGGRESVYEIILENGKLSKINRRKDKKQNTNKYRHRAYVTNIDRRNLGHQSYLGSARPQREGT